MDEPGLLEILSYFKEDCMELTTVFQASTNNLSHEDETRKIIQGKESSSAVNKVEEGQGFRGDQNYSKSELERIAGAIEEFAKSSGWEMKISINDKTDQTIVTIISRKDGQVLRQIPPEELIGIAERMQEMVGVILSDKV